MILPVFDTSIGVYDYEDFDDFVGKKNLENAIDKLFSLPIVTETPNVIDAHGGRALSTVHLDKKHIIDLLDLKHSPLGGWILKSMLITAAELGFDNDRDIRKFKFHRTWANRMYKNCDAIAHRHALKDHVIPHIVGIYYHEVPDNSADLIFIDDDNHDEIRGDRYYEYAEEKQFRVKPKAGRLICHDANILHATSIHESEQARTCFIIEVGFPPLGSHVT
jgi:hypothetical protein